jgi:hypothetical protein
MIAKSSGNQIETEDKDDVRQLIRFGAGRVGFL